MPYQRMSTSRLASASAGGLPATPFCEVLPVNRPHHDEMVQHLENVPRPGRATGIQPAPETASTPRRRASSTSSPCERPDAGNPGPRSDSAGQREREQCNQNEGHRLHRNLRFPGLAYAGSGIRFGCALVASRMDQLRRSRDRGVARTPARRNTSRAASRPVYRRPLSHAAFARPRIDEQQIIRELVGLAPTARRASSSAASGWATNWSCTTTVTAAAASRCRGDRRRSRCARHRPRPIGGPPSSAPASWA